MIFVICMVLLSLLMYIQWDSFLKLGISNGPDKAQKYIHHFFGVSLIIGIYSVGLAFAFSFWFLLSSLAVPGVAMGIVLIGYVAKNLFEKIALRLKMKNKKDANQ